MEKINFKPIELETRSIIQKSPEEICGILLDTGRWTEFKGYSFIPGIESAHFETKTPSITGSRIFVHNKDGSSHVEEITEWDTNNKAVFKFQEFNSPLKNFATHFIESWYFRKVNNGTEIHRTMALYPKNVFGWIFLHPIAGMLRKAIEKNLGQLKNS